MFLAIITVIIFLSVLIIVHELGHFFAAKKFGLFVEEFGFGLPPRIFGKKRGETIYSLNAVPFGGFVKIAGEDGEESQSEQSEIHPNNPNNTRIVERELSYKLTGLFFKVQDQLGRFSRESQYGDLLENLLKFEGIKYKRELPVSVENRFSNFVDFLIEDKIVLELKSKPFVTKEDYFQTKRYLEIMGLELGLIVNFREKYLKPKRVLNSKIRIYSEHSDVLVGSDRDRFFSFKPAWQKAIILVAGVSMNFFLGWILMSVVFFIGMPQVVLITDIAPKSPAAQVGLQSGDKVIGINDIRVYSEHSGEFVDLGRLIQLINQNQGKETVLKIERVGKVIDFKVVPRVNPPAHEGALGIALIDAGSPKIGPLKSIIEGFKTSITVAKDFVVGIINLIAKAFIGQAGLQDVVGPVGITKITAQANSLGFSYLLRLLALISINLAVINIFPFPALDGGRLLFLAIEKIKGSPLSIKFQRYANSIGMILLLFLMLVITIKDVVGLF